MAPKPSPSSSKHDGKHKNKKQQQHQQHQQQQLEASTSPSAATPDKFERELQALAAKARTETWGRAARAQAAVFGRAAVLLALAGACSTVSQLALSPDYGAIPAARWHAQLVAAACFAGWASNLLLARLLPFGPDRLLPVVAAYVPAAQFLLARAAGPWLTARWAPLATEAVTLFPLVALSAACVADLLDGADLSALPRWLADAAPGLGSYGCFKAAEAGFGALIARHVGRSLLATRLGMQAALAGAYALLAPSRLLLWAVPALLHTAVFNTHVPTPAALSRLNAALAPEGYVVLDRHESVTGYVSVIDSPKEGFRLLRCDHSLLGGEWVKFIGKGRFRGNQVAEPVYGVFAMLEAVRLVETPEPIRDDEARALVIGLGVGTTPAALVAHGIDTTVVEIDPVVHRFASKYFQLPSNHTAVIEDAVSYTTRLTADESAPRFDYIVHDVFTGGAEPVDLFTLEFLQNLDALLKPGGVIAINYAGDFALPPPRIVVQTIRAVFPACRIFREHPRDEAEFARTGRDFTNMVIFCTKQRPDPDPSHGHGHGHGHGRGAISFRTPTERDLLNSPSRQAYLLPQYEVRDEDFAAVDDDDDADAGAGAAAILWRNETERLAKWHETSALGHWRVMRTVLPDAVWQAW